MSAEMGRWQMSSYLQSEHIFVCAQIMQVHRRVCNEYR